MNVTSNPGIACVTGAAGGLGSAFANQLAQRGYRLLLVDLRPAPLEQICASIRDQHGVAVDAYPADLSRRDEVQRLSEHLGQLTDLDLLVNNAGFGTVDYFVDTHVDYLIGQIDVHVVAPTMFARAVLPGMMARNRGNIVNVSSVGGWFQSAGNVQYGSTKNYLANFSMSLAEELRGTNVRVQALCPGFVRTQFHAADSMKAFNPQKGPPASWWMAADVVVKCCLDNLSSNQVLVIPGLRYRLMARIAQMPLLRPLMQWITRLPRTSEKRATNSQPAVEPLPAPTFGMVKRA